MYIIIRETPDGEPVLATADPRVLRAVLRALEEISDVDARPRTRVLPLDAHHLRPKLEPGGEP